MRIGLSALAAAALLAGVATAVVAQTAPAPSNPNTKVYAYKKAAPSTMNPGVNVDPSTMTRQQKPFEHLIPDAQAYGTAAWWQEMSRTAGGDGGSQ